MLSSRVPKQSREPARLTGGPGTEQSLGALATLAGCEVAGDPALVVRGVANPETAGPDDMVFVLDTRFRDRVAQSNAGFVLAAEPFDGKAGLIAARPREAMALVLSAFIPRLPAPGIHPTAAIDPQAVLHESVSIGAGCAVAVGASVGQGTVLHPHVVIYPGARIGRDCVLHAGVIIREGCILGDRVVVQPGAVIGSDGFGFIPTKEGNLKIPQIGNVVIADDVEIGANCTLDRATIGSTVVGRGTKLDNLVHLAHNVTIGEACMLVAQVGISGSTQIGDRCIFGGQSGAVGHLKIADRVTVAAKSGVTKDTPPGATLSGFPARNHRDELKRLALVERLLGRVGRLEAKLRDLGEGEATR